MRTYVRRAVERHALEAYPRECCGLLVADQDKGKYIPCENSAENDNDFRISGEEYSRCEDMGQILAVIHSHVNTSARPSQSDLVSCEAQDLPWHIVSVYKDAGEEPRIGEWYSFEPSNYEAPLVGRTFHHGDLDCYGLVRDFYHREMGIDIPDFERPDFWWEKEDGGELYLDQFEKAGFRVVTGDLQLGDGILMQYRSDRTNHAGVYLGETTLASQPDLPPVPSALLHHAMPRLSERVPYMGYWKNITRLVVRHKSLL